MNKRYTSFNNSPKLNNWHTECNMNTVGSDDMQVQISKLEAKIRLAESKGNIGLADCLTQQLKQLKAQVK